MGGQRIHRTEEHGCLWVIWKGLNGFLATVQLAYPKSWTRRLPGGVRCMSVTRRDV
jgi:hypothetical protein